MTGVGTKKLSPSMRRVLENVLAGRRPTAGFPGGRSVSGGLSGTFVALHRRGLLALGGEITAAGRLALGSTDLFGSLRRAPRRVLMKAVDHGQAPGCQPGWRTAEGAHFVCPKCGHDAGWLFDLFPSEIRRGLPCPECNPSEAS